MKVTGQICLIVLYIVLFLFLQALCYEVLLLMRAERGVSLLLAAGISSVTVIIVFRCLRWSETGLRRFLVRKDALPVLLLTCVLAAALIIPMQYMEDYFSPSLSDELVQMFQSMTNLRGGYLVLGIIAPVAEETVFRGAILRSLMEINRHNWIAVVLSAIIFGAVHGNLAQFSHAFLVGILLGWLYIRTRSVLPCMAVHWVNNTVVIIAMKAFPDKANDNIEEFFGGNTLLFYAAMSISVIVAALALWQIIRLLKSPSESPA